MTNTKRITIKDLMEKIKELELKIENFDTLKKRIDDLEKEVHSLKNKNEFQSADKTTEKRFLCSKCDKTFSTINDLKRHDKSNHTDINCKSCEKVFFKSSDLEIHLEQEHKAERFKCKRCEKEFVLKWRLNKHEKIHNSQNVKKCHYFNNEKQCPFEKIGCMFEHSLAGQCRNGDLCKRKLCSFEHKNLGVENNIAKSIEINSVQCDEDIKKTDEEKSFDLNVKTNFPEIYDYYLTNQKHIPCYFCNYISKSQVLKSIENEMINYMDTNHEDIIEVFKSNDTEIENTIHVEFLEIFVPE